MKYSSISNIPARRVQPSSQARAVALPAPVWVRHGVLATFVAMVLGLAACKPNALTLTQDNLDKIQQDMSTADVKAILGEPSSSTTEPIPIVGGTKTTLTYTDQNATVTIVLKNDKVQTKEGHFGP